MIRSIFVISTYFLSYYKSTLRYSENTFKYKNRFHLCNITIYHILTKK